MSQCQSFTCPDGNCPGCKNGQLYCKDSRCAPYCSGCQMLPQYEAFGYTVITITLIFLVILLAILIYTYYPYFYSDYS